MAHDGVVVAPLGGVVIVLFLEGAVQGGVKLLQVRRKPLELDEPVVTTGFAYLDVVRCYGKVTYRCTRDPRTPPPKLALPPSVAGLPQRR